MGRLDKPPIICFWDTSRSVIAIARREISLLNDTVHVFCELDDHALYLGLMYPAEQLALFRAPSDVETFALRFVAESRLGDSEAAKIRLSFDRHLAQATSDPLLDGEYTELAQFIVYRNHPDVSLKTGFIRAPGTVDEALSRMADRVYVKGQPQATFEVTCKIKGEAVGPAFLVKNVDEQEEISIRFLCKRGEPSVLPSTGLEDSRLAAILLDPKWTKREMPQVDLAFGHNRYVALKALRQIIFFHATRSNGKTKIVTGESAKLIHKGDHWTARYVYTEVQHRDFVGVYSLTDNITCESQQSKFTTKSCSSGTLCGALFLGADIVSVSDDSDYLKTVCDALDHWADKRLGGHSRSAETRPPKPFYEAAIDWWLQAADVSGSDSATLPTTLEPYRRCLLKAQEADAEIRTALQAFQLNYLKFEDFISHPSLVRFLVWEPQLAKLVVDLQRLSPSQASPVAGQAFVLTLLSLLGETDKVSPANGADVQCAVLALFRKGIDLKALIEKKVIWPQRLADALDPDVGLLNILFRVPTAILAAAVEDIKSASLLARFGKVLVPFREAVALARIWREVDQAVREEMRSIWNKYCAIEGAEAETPPDKLNWPTQYREQAQDNPLEKLKGDFQRRQETAGPHVLPFYDEVAKLNTRFGVLFAGDLIDQIEAKDPILDKIVTAIHRTLQDGELHCFNELDSEKLAEQNSPVSTIAVQKMLQELTRFAPRLNTWKWSDEQRQKIEKFKQDLNQSLQKAQDWWLRAQSPVNKPYIKRKGLDLLDKCKALSLTIAAYVQEERLRIELKKLKESSRRLNGEERVRYERKFEAIEFAFEQKDGTRIQGLLRSFSILSTPQV